MSNWVMINHLFYLTHYSVLLLNRQKEKNLVYFQAKFVKFILQGQIWPTKKPKLAKFGLQQIKSCPGKGQNFVAFAIKCFEKWSNRVQM